MDATNVTIISGIILLAVFALAGWVSKRRRDGREQGPLRKGTSHGD
jgi:hypothetical protein